VRDRRGGASRAFAPLAVRPRRGLAARRPRERPARRRAAALLLAPALVLAAALEAAAAPGRPLTAEEVRRAAEAVLADPALQRELPERTEGAAAHGAGGARSRGSGERRAPAEGGDPGERAAPPPPIPSGGEEDAGRRPRRPSGEDPRAPRFAPPERGSEGAREVTLPSGGGAIGTAIVYGLGAAALILALVFVARGLIAGAGKAGAGRGAATEDASGNKDTAEEMTVLDLAEIERIAAAGRFAEACRALLVHTLDEIARRRRAPLPSALTSREAARELHLPASPEKALLDLVGQVERTHFGGRPAARADWELCRLRAREAAA
jgi:hypothetical protein